MNKLLQFHAEGVYLEAELVPLRSLVIEEKFLPVLCLALCELCACVCVVDIGIELCVCVCVCS